MDREMIIKITEDRRILVQESDGLSLTHKEIEPQAFYDCIRNSLKHDGISSGLLPEGCFHFSVDANGTRHVAMEYRALYADITYEKTSYSDFPIPKMVFLFGVDQDGRITRREIGVTENKKITLNSKMYIYPLSNVTGFNICIGSNPLPKIEKLTQLAGIPQYILSMPNNDDHYSSDKNKLGLESRALYEHLKDKDTAYYYSDVLMESGKTMKDFINY